MNSTLHPQYKIWLKETNYCPPMFAKITTAYAYDIEVKQYSCAANFQPWYQHTI